MTSVACPHCGGPIEVVASAATGIDCVPTPTSIAADAGHATSIEARVFEVIREHGPLVGRAVVAKAGRKHADAWAAIKTLETSGRVQKVHGGWIAREAPEQREAVEQRASVEHEQPFGDRTCPDCGGLRIDMAGTLTCFGCANRERMR